MQENKEELEDFILFESHQNEPKNEPKNETEDTLGVDIKALGQIVIAVVISFIFIFIYYLQKERHLSSLKRRLTKLRILLELRKHKKEKLDKYFKIAYPVIRFLLVAMFVLFDYLLYKFGLIKEFKDINTWNALILTALITFNFLIFGSLTNLEKMISWIEKTLKELIYKNDINIDTKIKKNAQNMIDTEKEIKKLEN